MKNYYYILGIGTSATEEDIKIAYRKLAFKFHPDYNQGDKFFEARFRDIQEGYETLSDKNKKIAYDNELYAFLNSRANQSQTNFNSKTTSENNVSDSEKDSESTIKKDIGVFYRKAKDTTNRIASFTMNAFLVILATACIAGMFSGLTKRCSSGTVDDNSSDETSKYNIYEDLEQSEMSSEQRKLKLISEGWKINNIKNGNMPICYSFKPKYGKLKNYLNISVGSNTDVVVKLINVSTEKCARYVYVTSNSSYKMRNIPEGLYYLKIAYGSKWMVLTKKKKCTGTFLENPIFKKGDDDLDFYRKDKGDSYSVPSFTLRLDITTSDYSNQFRSESITENQFNN